MSRKSDEIAARRVALGLRVISNETHNNTVIRQLRARSAQDNMAGTGFERRRPTGSEIIARPGVPEATENRPAYAGQPTKLTVAAVDGDSASVEVRASTLAKWLEEQYHANLAPFHFLSDLALNVDDLPEAAVVELATAMLQAQGWQVHVHYFNSAGCRAGSVTMMPPNSVGF